MTMTPWSLNQGCLSHRGPWLRMTFKIFWQPWSSWKCGIPWILGPNEFKSTKTSASEDWSRIKSSPLPTQLPGLTNSLPQWMLYGAILRCSWLTRREMINECRKILEPTIGYSATGFGERGQKCERHIESTVEPGPRDRQPALQSYTILIRAGEDHLTMKERKMYPNTVHWLAENYSRQIPVFVEDFEKRKDN